MKIKVSKNIDVEIEVDIHLLAIELAADDDDKQGEFFNKFFHELRKICSNKHDYEHQILVITKRLSMISKEAISSMNEFAILGKD